MADIVEVTGTTNGVNGVEAADFAVYPNPFVESVNLRFAEGGEYSIQVTAVNGAVMQNTKATANAGDVVNVAITGAKGLYIVRVMKNGKLYKAVKVVKEQAAILILKITLTLARCRSAILGIGLVLYYYSKMRCL